MYAIFQRLMYTILILDLKILVQPFFRISYRLIIFDIHLVVLYTPPEPLNKNIVQCSSSSIPTDTHISSLQPVDKLVTGKLRSLVIVENLWLRGLKCLVKCLQTKGCLQSAGGLPGQDIATEPVDNRDQIEKTSSQADIRDICAPNLIVSLNGQPAQQIRIPHDLLSRLAQPWFGIHRHQTHLPQQSGHTLVIDLLALRAQPGGHLLDAIKRCSGILFIQKAHQEQILLTHRHRLVIIAGTGQIYQLALSCDADAWVLRLDQRPLLLNAPDWLFFNQSISIFNCPISWYSAATNASSVRSRRSLPPENPVWISSNACFFHCVIWVG